MSCSGIWADDRWAVVENKAPLDMARSAAHRARVKLLLRGQETGRSVSIPEEQ